MIAILRLLFPSLLSILGAAGIAATMGGAAWFGRGLIFDWFEKPAIIRAERERCADEVEKAAAIARMEEERRQFQIALEATQRAADDEAKLRAQHDADLGKLNDRITAYETLRLGEGRSCPLDARDLDFLNGVLPD
jgi:hypothetical protein